MEVGESKIFDALTTWAYPGRVPKFKYKKVSGCHTQSLSYIQRKNHHELARHTSQKKESSSKLSGVEAQTPCK